eukprot:1161868-Pelagomonas_calceolata.AAC.20
MLNSQNLDWKGQIAKKGGRKGKSFIAVPAYKGSLAEAKKGDCNQTSPIWSSSAKTMKASRKRKEKKTLR